MGVVIRTEGFPVDIGKSQISAIYQLGESADFTLSTNLLAELIGTVANNMLNVGIINLIQPENVIWWTRFKRIFDDETESEWSNPEPVYGSDLNNSRFIKFDSSIERPSIKALLDNSGLTISVSDALIMGADGHLYTSYILYSNGKIIHTDMENKDALTELYIPITTLNFKQFNNITILVIQGTANGAESAIASAVVANSKLSFTLAGTFNNVPYNRGQNYRLTSTTNSVIVLDASVYVGSGDNLGEMNKLIYANSVDGLERYSEIFLDSTILEPANIYTLRITVSSALDSSIIEVFDYIVTTDDIDSPFIIDKDYVYRETITARFTSNTGIVPITNELEDFTMCYASSYRDILLSSIGYPSSLSVFKFQPNTLALKIEKDIDLDILEEVGKKVVFFTRNKKVIIIAADTDIELKIIVCSYNPYDNRKLVKESTMIYSSYDAIGIVERNGIILDNREEYLYYIEKNAIGSEFSRIKISDMTRELLTERPNMESAATISILDDDKILSLRGSSDITDFFIYSIRENLWSPYTSDYPLDPKYLNCFNAVLRKDGKVALFPAKNSTAKNFLVFNTEEKSFSTELIDISEDYTIDSIIRQADGSFILITSNAYDHTDKIICYLY